MVHKYIKIVLNTLLLTLTVIIATGCSNIGDIGGGTKPATTTPIVITGVTMTQLTADTNSIALTWANPSDSDLKSVNITWTDGTTPGSSSISGASTYTIASLAGTTEYTVTLTTENTAGNKSNPVSFSVSTSSTMIYYFIYTAADLDAVRGGVTGYASWTLSGNYILMADIDLSAYSPWTPIGDDGIDFVNIYAGVFEGNNHVINHLTINGTNDYLGLFGITDSASKIKNLGVQCSMIKSGDGSGGLAGANMGTISNCHVSGNLSSTTSTNGMLGGLAGVNTGTISNCYSTGIVTGTSFVGGLVGTNMDGTIISCYATNTVNGTSSVGGLVGYIKNGTISNCYATGSVTGDSAVGGLVGTPTGSITLSYAIGHVSGTTDVGGLIGDKDKGQGTFSYYDSTTTGVVDNGAGTPLTTPQMKVQANFTGWDFVGESANGTDNYWSIDTLNNGYPYLTNNH